MTTLILSGKLMKITFIFLLQTKQEKLKKKIKKNLFFSSFAKVCSRENNLFFRFAKAKFVPKTAKVSARGSSHHHPSLVELFAVYIFFYKILIKLGYKV